MIAIFLASNTSLYQINVLKFLIKLRRRPSVAPWHFLLHSSPLSDTKSCSLATVSNLHPTLCSTQFLPQRRQWDWAVIRVLICVCPQWSPLDNSHSPLLEIRTYPQKPSCYREMIAWWPASSDHAVAIPSAAASPALLPILRPKTTLNLNFSSI